MLYSTALQRVRVRRSLAAVSGLMAAFGFGGKYVCQSSVMYACAASAPPQMTRSFSTAQMYVSGQNRQDNQAAGGLLLQLRFCVELPRVHQRKPASRFESASRSPKPCAAVTPPKNRTSTHSRFGTSGGGSMHKAHHEPPFVFFPTCTVRCRNPFSPLPGDLSGGLWQKCCAPKIL